MIVEQNKHLNHTEENVSLHISANGNALCGTDWYATEPAPPYTRLYYIAEGEAHIDTAAGHTLLQADNLYLLPTGYPFSYHCDTRMRQLYFHVQLRNRDGFDLLRGIPTLLHTALSANYVQQLLTLQSSTDATDHLYLKSLLMRDIFALLSKYGLTLTEPHYSEGVRNALRFIENNLSLSLTVNAVANAVFLSPHTLAHKFKTEVGVSLGQYIDGLVLFKAKQFLQDTDLPLSHISELLGFCDQFYFSRRFREQFSISPLQYRKRHR